MDFCTCHEPSGYAPEKNGPLYFAGVCLVCGRLHERSALHFLTINDGANFSLQTDGVKMTPDVAEWLRALKTKLLGVMHERIAKIDSGAPGVRP